MVSSSSFFLEYTSENFSDSRKPPWDVLKRWKKNWKNFRQDFDNFDNNRCPKKIWDEAWILGISTLQEVIYYPVASSWYSVQPEVNTSVLPQTSCVRYIRYRLVATRRLLAGSVNTGR